MNWLRKIFRGKEAYVGSFKVKLNNEVIYVHCFETKHGHRRTELVNCDSYPATGWLKNYKRTELYQLRIKPWEEWGKKDDGIMTYNDVFDKKKEFLAKLKGDALWVIKHDNSG